MTTKPYFSVIIPSLNEEKYLPSLLSDLANQTHQDFEVIVVDGHSEDKTKEKALFYKDKLPALNFIDSPRRNVSFQRNLGGQAAHGKYLLFVDADTRLANYYLSGLVYRIMSDPTDVFTCWAAPETDTTTDKTISNIINMSIETSFLLDSPAAIGALIGCRREVFTTIRGFDDTVPFAEDTEFVKRAYKSGFSFKIYRDPKFVMSLRRFKKTGTVRSFQKYARLHLKRLIEADIDQPTEYPMGGKTFTKDASTQNLIDKTISALDAGKKIPRIVEKIKALFTLTEEE